MYIVSADLDSLYSGVSTVTNGITKLGFDKIVTPGILDTLKTGSTTIQTSISALSSSGLLQSSTISSLTSSSSFLTKHISSLSIGDIPSNPIMSGLSSVSKGMGGIVGSISSGGLTQLSPLSATPLDIGSAVVSKGLGFIKDSGMISSSTFGLLDAGVSAALDICSRYSKGQGRIGIGSIFGSIPNPIEQYIRAMCEKASHYTDVSTLTTQLDSSQSGLMSLKSQLRSTTDPSQIQSIQASIRTGMELVGILKSGISSATDSISTWDSHLTTIPTPSSTELSTFII